MGILNKNGKIEDAVFLECHNKELKIEVVEYGLRIGYIRELKSCPKRGLNEGNK